MKRTIDIQKTGYGHWKISMSYYGKTISTITTNSVAIDNYNSDEFEKKGRELRKNTGFNSLRAELIRSINN